MYYICLNCGQINDSLSCPYCREEISKEQYDAVMTDARRSIRYGYYYREIAEEEAKEKSNHLHYNILSPTNFLEWIAALVIAGVAYDTIKYVARNVYLFIKEKISTLGESDEKVIEVLEYEEKLIRFVKYTREFHAGLRDVDPEIVQYIQEEINADFTAEQTGAILNNEHRCPTTQEIMKIMQKRKSRTDLNIHYKEELEIFEELKKKSFRYRKGEG